MRSDDDSVLILAITSPCVDHGNRWAAYQCLVVIAAAILAQHQTSLPETPNPPNVAASGFLTFFTVPNLCQIRRAGQTQTIVEIYQQKQCQATFLSRFCRRVHGCRSGLNGMMTCDSKSPRSRSATTASASCHSCHSSRSMIMPRIDDVSRYLR